MSGSGVVDGIVVLSSDGLGEDGDGTVFGDDGVVNVLGYGVGTSVGPGSLLSLKRILYSLPNENF